MSSISWPYSELTPRNVSADLVAHSVSGGRSLSGAEQVLMSDAGYWEITLDQIPIRTNASVLLWRSIESSLKGRSHTILVPAYSRKFAPLANAANAIVAALVGNVAGGATELTLEMISGAIPPAAGEDFSVGERLYRIKRVVTISGDLYTVKFWPPAREAMLDGAAAEFDHAVCRCRLKEERGMDITLELLLFASPSVVFCEDV